MSIADEVLSIAELEAMDGCGRVGGRVIELGKGRVLLADGFGQRWLELDSAAPAQLGQWLVLDVESDRENWLVTRVVSSHAGQLRAAGEQVRAALVAPNLERMARAQRWIRRFFDEQDFLEVRTPMRVFAPDPSVYIAPHKTADGWLITSPEFHMKRLLVGGMRRVYQLASCTRDAELGAWHQPEFTLLEWYRAFASSQQVMADTEQLVLGLHAEFSHGPVRYAGRKVVVQGPFERITVRDAFARFAGITDVVDLAASDENRYFQHFVDDVEPALARFERPIFVTEYPRSQAALAAACEHDPNVAERFELYLAGVELCNGYGELTSPTEQRRRFESDLAIREQRGLPALPLDEEFLAALEEGMPPAAGNALGFERLMALLLGVELSDTMAFPMQKKA
jgi:elongation factor P--(R)-beta-lysine ligase